MLHIVMEQTAEHTANHCQVFIRVVQMERKSVKKEEREIIALFAINSSQEKTVKDVQTITIPKILAKLTAHQHLTDISALIKDRKNVFKTEQDLIVKSAC